MIEKIHQKLSDSKVARWSVLALAAFTMLCGYFLTDVMAPLKPMLEEQLSWTSTEYGWFTSAYGWFNVFLFMLIIGGIVLDKMGVRFTGVASCILMIIGCSIKYYAISGAFTMEGELFGWKAQVMVAALGSRSSVSAWRPPVSRYLRLSYGGSRKRDGVGYGLGDGYGSFGYGLGFIYHGSRRQVLR